MKQTPTTLDGVRYNPFPQAGCDGCAAWVANNPSPLCKKIRLADPNNTCLSPSVIWLTDVDFAARRLTEGVTDEL